MLTSSKRVYRHADREVKRMFRRMAAEFSNESLRAAWDALNVIAISNRVNRLYEDIDRYVRSRYLYIARRAYEDAWGFVGGVPLSSDELDDRIDPFFLIWMLDRYDPKTEYQYSKEWDRKRDRLKEAMMSVGQASNRVRVANTQRARQALKRALDLLERQVQQMAETATEEGRNQAFRDAGFDRLRWRTQEDSRVCQVCRDRNNRIYDTDALPPKHPRCRCYYVPAP